MPTHVITQKINFQSYRHFLFVKIFLNHALAHSDVKRITKYFDVEKRTNQLNVLLNGTVFFLEVVKYYDIDLHVKFCQH